MARHGSAFCLYFMDDFAVDRHDLALHHNAVADEAMRRVYVLLVDQAVRYFVRAASQTFWTASFDTV